MMTHDAICGKQGYSAASHISQGHRLFVLVVRSHDDVIVKQFENVLIEKQFENVRKRFM